MTLRLVTSGSLCALPPDRALGGFELGVRPASPLCEGPWQRLAMPVLAGEGATVHEAWLADGPVVSGTSDGVVWRRSGDVMFGVIDLSEEGATAAAGVSVLRTLSERAYGAIFRLLDAQGLPHLWRAWNYIPDIHGEESGLERYRQFNMGRGDAFEHCARSVTEQVPAACALGVNGGPLSIAFLAGASPVVPLENPRQVSAYLYPSVYGPRSPTFSRAALAHLPHQELLFVSGTASIVGHESLHRGDVAAQTDESLSNVRAVLAVANERSALAPISLDGLAYRVYVRNAADAPTVLRTMAERVGSAPAQCVQADICRSELLVEVEAWVLRGLPHPSGRP